MKKILKLNADLRGNSKGTLVVIHVDNKGIPLDQYWRYRLKDAKVDGCVEFVEEEKPNKKDKKET